MSTAVSNRTCHYDGVARADFPGSQKLPCQWHLLKCCSLQGCGSYHPSFFWVCCLSLPLDSYPFSPFAWCSWCSSSRRFILSSPPQDKNAMSRASHLADISLHGKPKLRLNSALKIFLYVCSHIFGFFGMGAGKRFSCLDLKSRERMHWVSKVDNPEQKIRVISAKQTLSMKRYSAFEKSILFWKCQFRRTINIAQDP